MQRFERNCFSPRIDIRGLSHSSMKTLAIDSGQGRLGRARAPARGGDTIIAGSRNF